MSFTLKHNDSSNFVRNHKDSDGIPVVNKRYPWFRDPASYNAIGRFTVKNKKDLEAKSFDCKDILHNLNISSFNGHNLLFVHTGNGESFEIQMYTADVQYDETIAIYHHYAGFSNKKTTSYNYRITAEAKSQMGITIGDAMKYYYYIHKDDPDFGFGDETNKGLKSQLISFVKNCVMASATSPNAIPFGSSSYGCGNVFIKLFRIEKNKPKWDFDNFINHFVFTNYSTVTNAMFGKNLAYFFTTGDSYTKINDIEIIRFDEPVSIVDVIDMYEDKKDHDVVYIRNRISKKLKKSQEELMDNYPQYVLPKGTLSDKVIMVLESRYSASVYTRLADLRDAKVMSYPLFAMRNMMTYDWIQGKSLSVIKEVVKDKLDIQSDSAVKYKAQKEGKPIDYYNDAGNKYLHDPEKQEYFYSRSWARRVRDKEVGKEKRAARYDMKEQLI